LQKKYPRALKSEIKDLLNGIMTDCTPLDSTVWQKVIKHMYNDSDYNKLRAQIIAARDKLPVQEITYSIFQKLVLQFQLVEHVFYLTSFNRLF
jgi:hypothetical protein